MRIIDLSSAVCSSDRQTGCRLSPDVPAASPSSRPRSVSRRRYLSSQPPAGTRCEDERRQWRGFVDRPAEHRNASWRRVGLYSDQRDLERKSVVKGKGVSVRVELGGGRLIKKKTNKNHKENKIKK